MSITITVNLASGESAKGIALELLSDGVPVARATIDDQGRAVFNTTATHGRLAVRFDRSTVDEA
ncbi:hypothetical protein [Pseudomonas allokribbensis]|jgi:hypothetical protein|uniref:hypothetical protein n=1 Tax=Pseudomonas allokribbensis TaxID=2774460 RepID=UPI000BDBB0B8|nr:hypothetical protein [Pseudomonas allokribbensis]PCR96326.1 hypothetical protein CP336_12235 [Pseudomonas fluorescens]